MTITMQEAAIWPIYEPSGYIARPGPENSGRAVLLAENRPSSAKKKTARYERFTTRVVVVSSLLMLTFTGALHIFNYGLQTQTSSTSGTHSGFSNTGNPGDTDSGDE